VFGINCYHTFYFGVSRKFTGGDRFFRYIGEKICTAATKNPYVAIYADFDRVYSGQAKDFDPTSYPDWYGETISASVGDPSQVSLHVGTGTYVNVYYVSTIPDYPVCSSEPCSVSVSWPSVTHIRSAGVSPAVTVSFTVENSTGVDRTIKLQLIYRGNVVAEKSVTVLNGKIGTVSVSHDDASTSPWTVREYEVRLYDGSYIIESGVVEVWYVGSYGGWGVLWTDTPRGSDFIAYDLAYNGIYVSNRVGRYGDTANYVLAVFSTLDVTGATIYDEVNTTTMNLKSYKINISGLLSQKYPYGKATRNVYRIAGTSYILLGQYDIVGKVPTSIQMGVQPL
jgi:hypothetical protein